VARVSFAPLKKIVSISLLAMLWALSEPAMARQPKAHDKAKVSTPHSEPAPQPELSGDAEASDNETVQHGAFDESAQKRLTALREWLTRRNLERKGGKVEDSGDAAALPPPLEEYKSIASREEYRRKMIREYEEWQGKRLKTLHIGRGPDGRIHHRYILRDTGTEITDLSELLDSMPDYSTPGKPTRRSPRNEATANDQAGKVPHVKDQTQRGKASTAKANSRKKSQSSKTGGQQRR